MLACSILPTILHAHCVLVMYKYCIYMYYVSITYTISLFPNAACSILHTHYVQITYMLRNHYVQITYVLHKHYVEITYLVQLSQSPGVRMQLVQCYVHSVMYTLHMCYVYITCVRTRYVEITYLVQQSQSPGVRMLLVQCYAHRSL